MHTLTAIDFETAQGKRHSICQVGLVRVEQGQVVHTMSQLVCPPDNYYFYKNIEIHGITPERTCTAPTFAKVWSELKPFIHGQTVVVHNGAFDFSCLQQTLAHYQMPQARFEQKWTYKIYGRDLASLCRQHKI